MKTKVKHSKRRNAWNVINLELGKKYKIASVPYAVGEKCYSLNVFEKKKAYEHAVFISKCFEDEERVQRILLN